MWVFKVLSMDFLLVCWFWTVLTTILKPTQTFYTIFLHFMEKSINQENNEQINLSGK